MKKYNYKRICSKMNQQSLFLLKTQTLKKDEQILINPLKGGGAAFKKQESAIFWNFSFDKGRLKSVVLWFLRKYGQYKTVELLERFKEIGFGYATKAGISLGIDDLKIPPQKIQLLVQAEKKIQEGQIQYQRGEITGVEHFQKLIDTWHQTSETLKQEVVRHFETTDLLNPVYMMAFSGARGNISQVRQLVGMRGLMADPQGQILDFPIRSNFREGLTLTEYIISTYGARKGIVDTALRTANAGYLTRRLVDVAQHVLVSEFDCGTKQGIYVFDMKEGNKTIYSFQQRLIGRVLAEDITSSALFLEKEGEKKNQKNNKTDNQKIAFRNQEISPDLALKISKITKKAMIRSPLTCQTKKLVCQLCYGWSLSNGKLVSIGEAVGIIAAQSIGEPGTQLTMRTFHTGGVFSGGLSEQIIAQYNGIVEYSSAIPGLCIRTLQGEIAFLTKNKGTLMFHKSDSLLSENFSSNKFSIDNFKEKNISSNQKHFLTTDVKNFSKKPMAQIFQLPPYTLLFARNKQFIFKKQIIGQILVIFQQKSQRGDAEQTIYSEFEGQIYNSHIDVIEKINESNDITVEAWGWGYLWILAGKTYQSPIFSYLFPSAMDFINKNSILNRINWVIPEKALIQNIAFSSPVSLQGSGTAIFNKNFSSNSNSILSFSPYKTSSALLPKKMPKFSPLLSLFKGASVSSQKHENLIFPKILKKNIHKENQVQENRKKEVIFKGFSPSFSNFNTLPPPQRGEGKEKFLINWSSTFVQTAKQQKIQKLGINNFSNSIRLRSFIQKDKSQNFYLIRKFPKKRMKFSNQDHLWNLNQQIYFDRSINKKWFFLNRFQNSTKFWLIKQFTNSLPLIYSFYPFQKLLKKTVFKWLNHSILKKNRLLKQPLNRKLANFFPRSSSPPSGVGGEDKIKLFLQFRKVSKFNTWTFIYLIHQKVNKKTIQTKISFPFSIAYPLNTVFSSFLKGTETFFSTDFRKTEDKKMDFFFSDSQKQDIKWEKLQNKGLDFAKGEEISPYVSPFFSSFPYCNLSYLQLAYQFPQFSFFQKKKENIYLTSKKNVHKLANKNGKQKGKEFNKSKKNQKCSNLSVYLQNTFQHKRWNKKRNREQNFFILKNERFKKPLFSKWAHFNKFTNMNRNSYLKELKSKASSNFIIKKPVLFLNLQYFHYKQLGYVFFGASKNKISYPLLPHPRRGRDGENFKRENQFLNNDAVYDYDNHYFSSNNLVSLNKFKTESYLKFKNPLISKEITEIDQFFSFVSLTTNNENIFVKNTFQWSPTPKILLKWFSNLATPNYQTTFPSSGLGICYRNNLSTMISFLSKRSIRAIYPEFLSVFFRKINPFIHSCQQAAIQKYFFNSKNLFFIQSFIYFAFPSQTFFSNFPKFSLAHMHLSSHFVERLSEKKSLHLFRGQKFSMRVKNKNDLVFQNNSIQLFQKFMDKSFKSSFYLINLYSSSYKRKLFCYQKWSQNKLNSKKIQKFHHFSLSNPFCLYKNTQSGSLNIQKNLGLKIKKLRWQNIFLNSKLKTQPFLNRRFQYAQKSWKWKFSSSVSSKNRKEIKELNTPFIYNPTSKLEVNWNEICWIPQETYKLYYWSLFPSKKQNWIQNKSLIFSSFPASSQSERKDSIEISLEKQLNSNLLSHNFEVLNNPNFLTFESFAFFYSKQFSLFYLINRQGIKKSFLSNVDGVVKLCSVSSQKKNWSFNKTQKMLVSSTNCDKFSNFFQFNTPLPSLFQNGLIRKDQMVNSSLLRKKHFSLASLPPPQRGEGEKKNSFSANMSSLENGLSSQFYTQPSFFSPIKLSKLSFSDKNDFHNKKVSQPLNNIDFSKLSTKIIHLNILPGWIYYTSNFSILRKLHQRIIPRSLHLLDDVFFEKHSVYLSCIHLNISFSKPMVLSYSYINRKTENAFGNTCKFQITSKIKNPKVRFLISNQISSQESKPYLMLLIRPVYDTILPSLHLLKKELYNSHHKLDEPSFSKLKWKQFYSSFLNKQKSDQKFIASFPNIDMKIMSKFRQPVFSSSGIKRGYFQKNGKKKRKFEKNITSYPLLPQPRRGRGGENFQKYFYSFQPFHFCSFNIELTIPSKFSSFFKKSFFNFHSLSNFSFSNWNSKISSKLLFFTYLNKQNEKLSFLILKNQTRLIFSNLNNSTLNFMNSFLLPDRERVDKKQSNFEKEDKFVNNYFLNKQKHLTKTEKLIYQNFDFFSAKSFYALPCFDFSVGEKMAYFANQKLFLTNLINKMLNNSVSPFSVFKPPVLPSFEDEQIQNSSKYPFIQSQVFSTRKGREKFPLDSFSSFPISKNELIMSSSPFISRNIPIATTSFLSPIEGELLPNFINIGSSLNNKGYLFLTASDLFSLSLISNICFLPILEKRNFSNLKTYKKQSLNNRLSLMSSFEKTEQKGLKKNFIQLQDNNSLFNFENSQEFEKIWNEKIIFQKRKNYPTYFELMHFIKVSSQHFLDSEKQLKMKFSEKKSNPLTTIIRYGSKFFKVKGLCIGNVKPYHPLRLGSFLVYGDVVSSETGIDEAGQIIHLNHSKITLRRAQPISASPKGILHAYNGDFISKNSAVITLPFQTLKTGDIVQGIPKVEQYFEARTTKRGRLFRDSLPNLLQGIFEGYRSLLPLEIAVQQSFLKIQQIIVDGVQRVYRSQGVSIADKHLEVVVRQMTSKVQIIHGGQTGFFPGELVDVEFIERVNRFLLHKIYYEPVILGITRASLEVDSFLSAASFQQTTKILSKAAIYKKKDFLRGLKENMMVGNLIPAGTGYLVYLQDLEKQSK